MLAGLPFEMHRHPDYDGDTRDISECVEVGRGVCLREWRRASDGILQRFLFAHERRNGFNPAIHASERCEGSVPINSSGSWEATGSLFEGDLTLTPSIYCTDPDGICGSAHGFVTNGTWRGV